MTSSTANPPRLLRRRTLLGLLLASPLAAAGCGLAIDAGRPSGPVAGSASTAATATSSERVLTTTGAGTTGSTALVASISSTAATTASSASVATTAGRARSTASSRSSATTTTTTTPATRQTTSTTVAPVAPRLRLAYVRDHDLYLRDEAGATTRLTSDGISGDPWWTDDGRTLFFSKTPRGQPAQTWRWQSETGLRQVRQGLWSPDGTAVAWEQPLAPDHQSATGVLVAQGGKSQQTAPAELGFAWQPLAWSQDSTRLVLGHFSLLGGGNTGTYRPNPPREGPATLWLAHAPFNSAGTKLPMPNDDQGQLGWPDAVLWSPDGGYLAVGVGPDQECQSCRADGIPFSAIPVAGGAPMPLEAALQQGALAWAPKGDWLVVSGPLGRETYIKKRLTRFDIAKGTHTDLTSDAAWSDVNPAISPDGGQIAFARGRSQQLGDSTVTAITSRRLWRMRADGTAQGQLTNAPGWTDEYPVWTPDGQWLVFVRWRPQISKIVPAATLWAVRPDGTQAHQLVDAIGTAADYAGGFGYFGQFHWSSLFALAPAAPSPSIAQVS